MKNTTYVTRNNSNLAEEWHKNGRLLDNTQHTRDQAAANAVFRRKPKSAATRLRDHVTTQYTRRSNICPTHFLAQSIKSGLCPMCEN